MSGNDYIPKLQHFVLSLAWKIYTNLKMVQFKDEKLYNENNLINWNFFINILSKLHVYKNFSLTEPTSILTKNEYDIVDKYLQGVIWSMKYFEGICINYNYYFPFCNPPTFQNIFKFSGNSIKIEYSTERPLSPIEFCLSLMPLAVILYYSNKKIILNVRVRTFFHKNISHSWNQILRFLIFIQKIGN